LWTYLPTPRNRHRLFLRRPWNGSPTIGEKKTRAEMVGMLVADFGWDRNGRTIERSLDGIIAELSAR